MAANIKGKHITGRTRIAPSAKLSKEATAIFVATVQSVDPTHFSDVDRPLLEQYAGAAALAHEAQRHIDTEGAVIEGKVSPWVAVLEKASRSCVALSARLRVCPQSRFDRLVAGANSRQQPGRGKPFHATDPNDPLAEFFPLEVPDSWREFGDQGGKQ